MIGTEKKNQNEAKNSESQNPEIKGNETENGGAEAGIKKKKTGKLINKINGLPRTLRALLLLSIAACVLMFAFKFHSDAKGIGDAIGNVAGWGTGRAIGTVDGLTRGQMEGYEAGKAEGLLAKDITVELTGKMQEINKLEVLVASGTFSDIISIGEDPVDYAALLSMKYNAVITVDLGTAEVTQKSDGLHILLDQPEVEFIPLGEVKKINEFQRPGFISEKGSAKDGYDAADNSLNNIPEEARRKFQEDESLMNSAKLSAQTQLSQLANAMMVNPEPVFVAFRGGTENE